MSAEEAERKISTSSGDENEAKLTNNVKKGRKSSIYEQKQIEAPVTTKGNRIMARTENLFKQYQRDIVVHEAKPLAGVNKADGSPVTNGEKSKVEIAREEKQRELAEIKKQYQQRLEEDERAQAQERMKQRENEEIKYRRRSRKYHFKS